MRVGFTVGGRAVYLHRTLESWREVRGIEDAYLLFSVEPGQDDARRVCETFARSNIARVTRVRSNARRLGVVTNPWVTMERLFGLIEPRGAGFAILCEEDSLVSEDVLEFFGWAEGAYAQDDEIRAVTAHHLSAPTGTEAEAERCQLFSATCWGTWHDRWEQAISPQWGFHRREGNCWDRTLVLGLMRDGKHVIRPCQSRNQHIGAQGSANNAPDFFPHTQAAQWERRHPPVDWTERATLRWKTAYLSG